ncbi:MAG TPA: response regulator [Rhodocyclaceae bacterium]|jgi:DNA-binding response OmpR family regulator|nr:response regulator [Rhodocyclaceae bacterium]
MKPVEVLLVEDDPGDVILTQEGLRASKLHINLHVVDNGEKALAFLRQEPPYDDAPRPGLIILDLNLPRVNGMEVLREIKTNDDLRTIPTVILTTSRAEEDVVKSYKLGANCYVSKPLNLDEFVKVVGSIESFWFTVVEIAG